MRSLRGLRRALVLGLLLAGVGAAWAEDAPEVLPAPQLLERLQEARRAGDIRAIEALVRASSEAHNRCRSASTRVRLRGALGELARDESAGGNRLYAIDALGRLDDSQGAWRELRRSVPDPAAATVDPAGRRVLRALGLLTYDPSLADLERMAREGRDPEAVSLAVEALGRFRFSRNRAHVLETLYVVGRDSETSPSRGTAREDEARQQWRRVVGDIVRAMDALTGRGIGSLDRYEALLRENDGRWERLFAEDDR
ncbi:MAG: hypothetical protein AB7T63_13855 [Planctomycetota bacterium]